jgi:hypothetical protein
MGYLAEVYVVARPALRIGSLAALPHTLGAKNRIHLSWIVKQRHEPKIHVHLVVTTEQRHSWIVGLTVDVKRAFLTPVESGLRKLSRPLIR